MKAVSNIEIRVQGKVGALELKPSNYDVKDTIQVLQTVEDLLFPNTKKDRPTINYSIEEGSVKHIFTTSFQAVIALQAILLQVKEKASIDFLEPNTAKSIEILQDMAIKKNVSIDFYTSETTESLIHLNSNTKYFRTTHEWVQTELYFYGTLTNAGGKNKPNIHIDTQEYGSIIIKTEKSYLSEQNENLLYKKVGVRALGLQSLDTGEIDRNSFALISLVDYQPKFDESYLNNLIQKAAKSWEDVEDADKWVHDIRGGYEL